MTHHQNFLKGALIGGFIASAATLLLASKKDEILREGCHLKSKACEISDHIKKKGCQVLHAFDDDSDNHDLLIGGALGAVVAAVAALLLVPEMREKLQEALGDTYHEIHKKAEDFASDIQSKGEYITEEISDWKDALVSIAKKLTSPKGRHKNSHFNEILEYATLGLQLFQQMKNRK